MIITWHGGGCYKISASKADIITDSFSSNAGERLKADLILKTDAANKINFNEIKESEIVIPGEYEISGIQIKGIAVDNGKKTIYKVLVDDINLGFLGDIDAELDENTLDNLGKIDILFIPAKIISGKLIKSINPSIAIPGWGDPKIVMSEIGQKPDPVDKLVIKKKDLEANEGFRLIILK